MDASLAAFALYYKVMQDVMANMKRNTSIDETVIQQIEETWCHKLIADGLQGNELNPNLPDSAISIRRVSWERAVRHVEEHTETSYIGPSYVTENGKSKRDLSNIQGKDPVLSSIRTFDQFNQNVPSIVLPSMQNSTLGNPNMVKNLPQQSQLQAMKRLSPLNNESQSKKPASSTIMNSSQSTASNTLSETNSSILPKIQNDQLNSSSQLNITNSHLGDGNLGDDDEFEDVSLDALPVSTLQNSKQLCDQAQNLIANTPQEQPGQVWDDTELVSDDDELPAEQYAEGFKPGLTLYEDVKRMKKVKTAWGRWNIKFSYGILRIGYDDILYHKADGQLHW